MPEMPEIQAPQVSWTHWVTATLIMAFGLVGYVNQSVYTRSEGEKLEREVQDIKKTGRDDLREIRDKMDQMLRMVMELKRARQHD